MSQANPASAAAESAVQQLLGQWTQGEATAKAPDWLKGLRAQAHDDLQTLSVPARRHEAWRYTATDFLQQGSYQLLSDEAFAALQLSDIDELLIGDDTHRLVFINGRFAPQLSLLEVPEDGLNLANIGGELGKVSAQAQAQLGQVAAHRHLFEALNSALLSDGAVVEVEAGAQLRKPIELLHIAVGLDEPLVAHPRHLVLLHPGAQAQLIERYCAIGDSEYLNNALVEVLLHESSQLQHQRVQTESHRARHITDLHVRQEAGSEYQMLQVSLGAAWSRCDLRLEFVGEQAQARINGLLLASDQQLTDMHSEVLHSVPHCTSEETIKGILDGKGRLVFDGLIHVARDAQKTDAMLANNNLLLSRSAEVDTKPQLEIFADDVKCSHGTTVGELDANMLFYLRSRGIPLAQARQMLSLGFAEQVLQSIAHAGLQEHTELRLKKRLGGLS